MLIEKKKKSEDNTVVKFDGVDCENHSVDADNYVTWKRQMKCILVKNDAWDYVNGTQVRPNSGADQITAWQAKDAKAETDIVLSISDEELGLVDDCTSAREIWLKLELVFQSKGPARKATLLKKIILSRLKEEEKIRTHVTRFFEAVTTLKEIGVDMNEDVSTILLLYSLPDAYANFRCVIETRDDLSEPDVLRVKILEEYQTRKVTGENTGGQDAMYVKNNL